MRIALVSRELFPLGGGGIGQFVNAAARLLAGVAEVAIVTNAAYEPEYRRLREQADPRLPPPEVRIAFVSDPTADEVGSFFSFTHRYSARVHERLVELYPDGGPDIIEFPDYLGEGFVTVQAARTLDPFLERTLVCVRAHTSAEMCSVLDGHLPADFQSRITFAMERSTLEDADRLIWQGGDILATYRRFYGSALAPDVRIRYPFRGATANPGADRGLELEAPVRLIYCGRFERRKGVHNLVRAATVLKRKDWELTLVGGDTATGPLGTSMRELVELTSFGDSRIDLVAGLARERVADLVCEHDVVVLPSLWECWPYAALEALHLNRPVLATPTGGFTEMIRPGVSGWLTAGTSAECLADGLRTMLDGRAEAERMIREERPLAAARELSDDREILDGYEELASAPRPRQRRPRGQGLRPPLVSAIVPYYRAQEFVEQTVRSLIAQTYPRIEIILVNDGSFEDPDWIVAELAARYPLIVVSQPNSGLGAARNFGVRQSRGRYVLPLDADNTVEPTFVERCVDVLESDRDVAYVTAWSRYIDGRGEPLDPPDGYQPFGNRHPVNALNNVAGDAAALVRRRVFDLGLSYSEELASYEDWAFYRELQRRGHFGVVIPERLIGYRVREDSMTSEVALANRQRIDAEIAAFLRENEVRWTSVSG
jgi:glycosyltransferase involved in cell wall biosynthesis